MTIGRGIDMRTVPLNVIDEAVECIGDGTITGHVDDPQTARLVEEIRGEAIRRQVLIKRDASPTRVHRLTLAPRPEADDLSGKGAEVSGGRWNRKGAPMVYASSSRALACLETLVHLARAPLPLNRYLVEVIVPADVWTQTDDFDVDRNVGWDAQPAGRVSLDWGTRWLTSMRSALARVPSIVVPEEVNVLINPRHPDAGKMRARKRRRWLYDGRLHRTAHAS